jgi:phosphate starvation-inducible PhoH-like protein
LKAPTKHSHQLEFDDPEAFRALCGPAASHLKKLEIEKGVEISTRGTQVHIEGEPFTVALIANALEQLYGVARRGYPLYVEDVLRAVEILSGDTSIRLEEVLMKQVLVGHGKKTIAPKTPQQRTYTEAIQNQDVVFAVGPAGTGKTYLAMAMAVAALQKKEVKRIILTRPAVEAGEKLGFLPGDLMEKVNPYVRPLYDALHEMMDAERVYRMVEEGTIEVAPLAFMRGRTLNHAFVILDEAQNTTRLQMKMFLTRLGHSAKAVITGDVTQVDLPVNVQSGLLDATRILRGVRGIEIIQFSAKDVVRHPLVERIVRAYEKEDEERGTSRAIQERRERDKHDSG